MVECITNITLQDVLLLFFLLFSFYLWRPIQFENRNCLDPFVWSIIMLTAVDSLQQNVHYWSYVLSIDPCQPSKLSVWSRWDGCLKYVMIIEWKGDDIMMIKLRTSLRKFFKIISAILIEYPVFLDILLLGAFYSQVLVW